jgi:hypothetical protein
MLFAGIELAHHGTDTNPSICGTGPLQLHALKPTYVGPGGSLVLSLLHVTFLMPSFF